MTPAADALPASADVLVVGAGIAGCALAFELARRGVGCLLVDRERPGAGASGVPAALINPYRGRSARASSADLAGARAFWELAADLDSEGAASGAQRSGVLRIPDQERQARAWRRMAAGGAGPRWLEAGEVPPPYHAPHGALLVEEGGWVDTRTLLGALAAAARRRGAVTSSGVELLSVAVGQGAPVRALLARRSREADDRRRRTENAVERSTGHAAGHTAEFTVTCRAVVVATGAWRPAGLRLPRFELVWGAALVLDLAGAPTPPYPLAGGVVAAFPPGRAVLSGGHRTLPEAGAAVGFEPAGFEPAGFEPGVFEPAGLRRALAWQLPALDQAPEVRRWQGVRAKRASGEPVARRLYPGVYLLNGFGGRGFLRAAAVAARLAERLAAGA